MRILKIAAVSVMLVSLFFAGCSANDDLEGTSWLLESLSGRAAKPDTTVTLRFEDGRALGNDGCNSYGAAYKVRGSRFELTEPIASTLMACQEPIMEQAASYVAALAEASTYRIEGQRLILANRSGETLAVFSPQSRELSGTVWIVTGYNNGQEAVVSLMEGTEITADFGEDGTLSGSAGCNRYTASFETDGSALSIGPVAATRMMCAEPEGVMEQEALYLRALESAANYQLEGNTLHLRAADGALAVTLERAR